MNDIMVDLETMATTADAAIVSIGAVKFDLSSDRVSDEGFYASISLQSNMDYHRAISEDTFQWWLKQAVDNPKSVGVFHEHKQGIDDALAAFALWCADGVEDEREASIIMKDRRVWSNGANFDEPILAHALTHCRLPIPWKFWNVRCVRTWKNLPGAKDVVVPRVGVHHNALADALTQAALVQAIYRKLFIKMKKVALA